MIPYQKYVRGHRGMIIEIDKKELLSIGEIDMDVEGTKTLQ